MDLFFYNWHIKVSCTLELHIYVFLDEDSSSVVLSPFRWVTSGALNSTAPCERSSGPRPPHADQSQSQLSPRTNTTAPPHQHGGRTVRSSRQKDKAQQLHEIASSPCRARLPYPSILFKDDDKTTTTRAKRACSPPHPVGSNHVPHP